MAVSQSVFPGMPPFDSEVKHVWEMTRFNCVLSRRLLSAFNDSIASMVWKFIRLDPGIFLIFQWNSTKY